MTNTPDAPFGKHLLQDPRCHNNRHYDIHDRDLRQSAAQTPGLKSPSSANPKTHGSKNSSDKPSAAIDPKGFQSFFAQWVQDMAQSLNGKTVAIDGQIA